MSSLWYPSVKQSPIQGYTGFGGGSTGLNYHHTAAGGGGDNYAVDFNGSNEWLGIPDNSVFTLGTGDWTIEAFYKGDTGSSSYDCLVSFGWKFQLYWYDTKFIMYLQGGGGYFIDGDNTGSSSASLNTWYHIAVTRENNDFKMWLDGVEKSNTSHSDSIGDPSNDAAIGRFGPSANYYAQGLISNFRFTKGQALYTSNFTKPSQALTTTSQGATASNVKLLCCNKATVTGSDATPDTISAGGSPSVVTGPF